jgi:lipoprotein-anchoring transpeptidase ErfK/SrfK
MKNVLLILNVVLLLTFAAAAQAGAADHSNIVVSVPDQKLTLFRNGVRVASYRISTSRFGLGDGRGSYRTPLGTLAIAKKIGDGAPMGSVFKGRRRTGEVVAPNSPGRDPIVTRILWLDGLERGNGNAFERGIYIHGTPQERLIGRPASYGCVRMRSCDIVKLYRLVETGTRVHILNAPTHRALRSLAGRPSFGSGTS